MHVINTRYYSNHQSEAHTQEYIEEMLKSFNNSYKIDYVKHIIIVTLTLLLVQSITKTRISILPRELMNLLETKWLDVFIDKHN